MVKYILIPEYRPLYAMRHCFGPTHGPLTKPCPTPVDVIGQLLQQTGKEAVSIYEVKYDTVKQTTTGDPIRLTLENYKMPYDQIVNTKAVEPESRSVTMVSEVKTVKPTIVLPKEATTISNVTEITEESVIAVENKEEVPVSDELIVDVKKEEVHTTSTVAETEVSVETEPVNNSYGDSNKEEVAEPTVLEEKVLPNLEGTIVVGESLSVSLPKEETPRLTKSQRKELRRQALKEQRREMQERRNALAEKEASTETTPEV